MEVQRGPVEKATVQDDVQPPKLRLRADRELRRQRCRRQTLDLARSTGASRESLQHALCAKTIRMNWLCSLELGAS